MKSKLFFIVALFCVFENDAWAQEFPIGIWFGGNQNAIDSVHAMGFTWIQAYGGWDRNSVNNQILQNTRNLKVLAILDRNINLSSFAQRMEYQAERASSENDTRNYFAAHPIGEVDPAPPATPTFWKALVANPSYGAGFMVQTPMPDDQYFYTGRNHWVMSFRMRIDPGGNPNARVARVEIVRKSDGFNLIPTGSKVEFIQSDFNGANFDMLEVPYTIIPIPVVKSFKLPVTAAQVAQSNLAVDVRIHWYDEVNTYLDWVALEDSVIHPNNVGAYQLFRGLRDSLITADASFFASQTTYPLLQRFYLKDEPFYNGYQPFNYVDQRILNTAGMQGSATGRGRGITATPTHSQGTSNVNASFTRFMNDGQPYEMFVDAYPIHADIPAPKSYIPTTDATAAGIATDTVNYTTKLQGSLGWMITNSFRPAIQVAQSSGAPWWYIAQVHGELSDNTGQYRKCDGTNDPMLRPPSPEEIRCMVNLSLAYGAKGVFYFWFPSTYEETNNFGGCSEVHFPGLIAVGSENNTPNHSSNYDVFDGDTVFTGYQKKYAEVKALNNVLKTLGPILLNRTWVAAFTSGEAAPGGSIVTSLTGSYIEAATFNSDFIMLVNRKCHPSDVQTIEITTNKSGQWVMKDTLNKELFVSSNGVFKNITLNPGQGRLFQLRALTTNENWSGTINVANAVTIANGSTLTIQPGATLKFSSAANLTINGKIIASSTDPTKRIAFTGVNSTKGYWAGIRIYSGSSTNVSTLRRCDVQYATNAVSITYTGVNNYVTIDKCKLIQNSGDGVYVLGLGYGATVEPMIRNSTMSNNSGNGVSLSSFAKPTVRLNRLENNLESGLYAASSSSAKVDSNFVSGNDNKGLWFEYASAAELNRNTIKNNEIRGVYCFSSSSVLAYGATDHKGRNEITGTNGVGIYASNSAAFFGQNLSGQYGNNWIHDNTSYEAQRAGSGSGALMAEQCYWSGQNSNISGNVDNSPALSSAPNPVGWGQGDSYDPTYLPQRGGDDKNPIVTITASGPDFGNNGVAANFTDDLDAAILEGLNTGNWNPAAFVLTLLQLELQNARVPAVDFAAVTAYANNAAVASDIRKMLVLVLVQYDNLVNDIPAALSTLQTFRQIIPGEGAELLANEGLLHLFRQNDISSAQSIVSELETMASGGDTLAAEHAKSLGRIIADYQLHQVDAELSKPRAEARLEQSLPVTAALSQNYPNPFNPTTMIRFYLPEAQNVRLQIFDLNGALVRTLFDEVLPAGGQTMVWDGRDQNGRITASGVYFYTLVRGQQIERKKMILVR